MTARLRCLGWFATLAFAGVAQAVCLVDAAVQALTMTWRARAVQ